MKRRKIDLSIRLVKMIKPLSFYMLTAILMGMLGNLCAIAIPVLGGYGVIRIINPQSTGFTLKAIAVAAVIMAIMRSVLRYAEQACNHFIAFKLLALIRDKVFKALRRLSPAKLECKDKGNLISLITSDVELLEVFYAHTISPIVIAVLVSIVMVAYISTFSIFLGMVFFIAYAVVGIVIPCIYYKFYSGQSSEYCNSLGELNSFVLDCLRGLNEILQFEYHDKKLSELKRKTEELIEDEKVMKKSSAYISVLINTAVFLFSLITLLTALFLYNTGTIGINGLIIPVIAILSSFSPVAAIANLSTVLSKTFAAAERVFDIIDEKPVVEENGNGAEVKFKDASCENISFSYGSDLILSDVCISIPQNKIIGLCGKSGSGKSTLIKLLMRFWDVEHGEIKISGKNVKNIKTSSLRDVECSMSQDTFIFNDTLKNNIKIAKLDANDEEIEHACKKAAIHEFIDSLPDKYDTIAGELGEKISGGERQRIGLARIFLNDAPFILLDEPTSNLDNLNEGQILLSLNNQRKNKTIFLVSHRDSTMRIADEIYRFEKGKLSL